MEIPVYSGRPLSIISRYTGPNAPQKPLWFWSNAKNLHRETPELIDQLTQAGYQLLPEEETEWRAIATTQFTDTITVLVDPERQTANFYLHPDNIAHLKKYPVSLAFPLGMPAKEISIPMLQFLPLPQIGEYAVVQGKKEDTVSVYHVEDLPEQAQLIWQMLGQQLRDLAAPGGWYLHSEMHSICETEERYSQVRTGIEAEQATQTDTRAQRAARTALQHLEEAHTQLLDVRQSWLKSDWLERWKDVSRMAQELSASYYEHHEHQAANKKTRIAAIPSVTSTQNTMVPSANAMRGLAQSFGPGIAIQPGLWNSETSQEMTLSTPNNSLLRVKGTTDGERSVLHKYITEEIGVEGLKHMVGVLHAYYNATGARERKDDAVVSPYGLLAMMGYERPENKEEQRKLMNTMLYLASTWIETSETYYEEERRGRGIRRRGGVRYSPLIVVEGLKASEEDGLTIPEAVEFHLGREFYDLLFGDRQRFFSLPTAQLLSYHSQKEQQEICLSFYITNFITMNAGRNYSIYFPNLLEGSAIRLEQSIEKSINRTRDALRTIYALEHLQRDGWFIRLAHEDVDTALAAEFYLKESNPEKLAEETRKRITGKYAYLASRSTQELKRMRRIALQSLLDGEGKAIEFKPGTLLQAQAEKIDAGRQRAKARNERAITARAIKAARRAVSRDLAEGASSD